MPDDLSCTTIAIANANVDHTAANVNTPAHCDPYFYFDTNVHPYPHTHSHPNVICITGHAAALVPDADHGEYSRSGFRSGRMAVSLGQRHRLDAG